MCEDRTERLKDFPSVVLYSLWRNFLIILYVVAYKKSQLCRLVQFGIEGDFFFFVFSISYSSLSASYLPTSFYVCFLHIFSWMCPIFSLTFSPPLAALCLMRCLMGVEEDMLFINRVWRVLKSVYSGAWWCFYFNQVCSWFCGTVNSAVPNRVQSTGV